MKPTPLIELQNVTLERSGRAILSNVSATIEPGEFIGVFGANGSGKSTLLHAILGLVTPAAGTIHVFGAPAARGIRNAGYLPQHRTPMGDLRLRGWDFVASAYQGERWGLPRIGRAARREVTWAIDTVEAGALAERPLRELSGGEVQRLLLAQALLGRPRLLLLDEPLISLDPHYQDAVVQLVRRVQKAHGMTCLFTAHELNSLLGTMDRVLYLAQGHAALGTPEAVITDEVLSSLYGIPIEVLRVKDRIVVVSGHGTSDHHGHHHHA
ncbi:MAG TPA: ATP-binding cassette domain-containing protein [bacterium]